MHTYFHTEMGMYECVFLHVLEEQEASMEPNQVAQNAALSACEKGKQWQMALVLLELLPKKRLTPDDISPWPRCKE